LAAEAAGALFILERDPMKKLILSLLLLAIGMHSQTGTVIQDTIYTQFSGQPFTGRVTLTTQAFTDSLGAYYAASMQTIQVTGGRFRAVLVPAIPTVQVDYYPAPGTGNHWFEFWAIPASAIPLRISAVQSPKILNSGIIGLSDGCLFISGGKIFSTGIPCGSGGGPIRWSSLTSSVWAGITSTTWSTLQQ
jgi:hypothetical protein